MGEWPAGAYPMSQDNAEMLRWLLSSGAVAETAIDELLLIAVHRNATACARLLLEAGADWRYENFRKFCSADVVVDLEIARMLVDYGADPARLNSYALKLYIGLGFTRTVDLTWQECLDGYYRRFGITNPERIKIPFWDVMVLTSSHPLEVESWFRHTPGRCEGSLPWCYCRDGMSFTVLPDGRFIQIGGSLRNSSKPVDHWVYNDAILHDGKGGFEILGYPEEVFPPTDFHTATLAGEWIYLIGNLGYPNARGPETPVYRLHVESLMIEKIQSTGESPGWIHEHKAALENGRIRISGGKRPVDDPKSSSSTEDLSDSYWFDPASGIWEKERSGTIADELG